MTMSRYHSKISQKATYLRVYEDNRMLYGEEVTGIIHNLEKRIVELEGLVEDIVDAESADEKLRPMMYHVWLFKAKALKEKT
jgi:hypothetical protein